MNIGSVFYNTTDEGKQYMNVVLDEVVKELYPALKELKITLKENENRSENAPIYHISMYKPKPKV
jgi:uncharacterized protein (DUF736 family)